MIFLQALPEKLETTQPHIQLILPAGFRPSLWISGGIDPILQYWSFFRLPQPARHRETEMTSTRGHR